MEPPPATGRGRWRRTEEIVAHVEREAELVSGVSAECLSPNAYRSVIYIKTRLAKAINERIDEPDRRDGETRLALGRVLWASLVCRVSREPET